MALPFLHQVALKSIEKYSKQLIAGIKGEFFMGGRVRVDETALRLRLWSSMAEKDFEVSLFTPLETQELKDAVNDAYRVHILREGWTLCGYHWPPLSKQHPDDVWVSFEDKECLPFVNCRSCLSAPTVTENGRPA